MSVSCGRGGQIEIAMSLSEQEVINRIREQLDFEKIDEQWSFPVRTNDNGDYILLGFGVGYWDAGDAITYNQAPAEGTYAEQIVHEHEEGTPSPPRMYFESNWTAKFNGNKVRMSTTLEGVGRISFTIPHDGLWAKEENCLS